MGLDEASASIVPRARGELALLLSRSPCNGYFRAAASDPTIAYQKYAVACSIGTVGGRAGFHARGGGAKFLQDLEGLGYISVTSNNLENIKNHRENGSSRFIVVVFVIPMPF